MPAPHLVLGIWPFALASQTRVPGPHRLSQSQRSGLGLRKARCPWTVLTGSIPADPAVVESDGKRGHLWDTFDGTSHVIPGNYCHRCMGAESRFVEPFVTDFRGIDRPALDPGRFLRTEEAGGSNPLTSTARKPKRCLGFRHFLGTPDTLAFRSRDTYRTPAPEVRGFLHSRLPGVTERGTVGRR